jgi:sugar phosphate isomerase/epimerase
MPQFAVSSWSLDGLLTSGTPLLELPGLMRQHQLFTLELCHFHLPTTDPTYLETFKQRLQAAGIELFSILIDAGNIASADASQIAADDLLIGQYIGVAATLGAKRVRIDAGLEPPTPEVIVRSARRLQEYAQIAASSGLQVSTENWHATSQNPEVLLEILERCAGTVQLCADTGNAEASSDKYQTLALLLPKASVVHFKPRYTAGGDIDMLDLEHCVRLIQEANFDGVLTLIFDQKQNEWQGIARLCDALQSRLEPVNPRLIR